MFLLLITFHVEQKKGEGEITMKRNKNSARTGRFVLLPPAKGACQECAAFHDKETPHNRGSIFYQMNFYIKTGRLPGWKDAMAHCSDGVKELWTAELNKKGIEV